MKQQTRAKIRFILSITLIVGFFALLIILIFYPIPTDNADILKVLVGFVGGAFVTMVAFWFGDSEGNAKEETDER